MRNRRGDGVFWFMIIFFPTVALLFLGGVIAIMAPASLFGRQCDDRATYEPDMPPAVPGSELVGQERMAERSGSAQMHYRLMVASPVEDIVAFYAGLDYECEGRTTCTLARTGRFNSRDQVLIPPEATDLAGSTAYTHIVTWDTCDAESF